MDYTTCRQTVCTHDGGDCAWDTIETRPVCPDDLSSPPEHIVDTSYYVIVRNAISIRWYLDGTIKLYKYGALYKTWSPKPTPEELVDARDSSVGVVVFPDGGIIMKDDDHFYYWGASFTGVPEIGYGGWIYA